MVFGHLATLGSFISNSKITYRYSLSCKSSTGSRPWGFWMGVMRFCFCWSWMIREGWPGPGCSWVWGCEVREVPGTGWVAVEASGGAGEGLPLGVGTGSFCGTLEDSAPWPKKTQSPMNYCELALVVSTWIAYFSEKFDHIQWFLQSSSR